MKVSIKEISIVKPAIETPHKSLWISDLDLLVARVHVPTVRFYKQHSNSSNFFDVEVLKDALSEVLVHFYPLAGRLGRDKNGRIEINCNGDGALFIDAEASCTLDDFGDFTPCSDTLQMAPAFDYSTDISSYPLLAVQVTRLKCGSVCLGVCFHHTVADGLSTSHFINAWSGLARGISISVPPFIDRTILKARDPPTPTFHHTEYDPPQPSKNPKPVNTPNDIKPTSTKILKITHEQLTTLKSKFKNEGRNGTPYSTFEVLATHIWYCMCKARNLTDVQETKLYIVLDGRSRLLPSLPLGYFGNVLFTTAVSSSLGEIQSRPLAQTTEKIHNSLKQRHDAYLRSALDYLKIQPDLTVLMRGADTFKCPNVHVVSWIRFPIFEADFGWGRPIYMTPAKVLFEGTAYILPNPTDDNSLSIILRLHTDHMESFCNIFYDFTTRNLESHKAPKL